MIETNSDNDKKLNISNGKVKDTISNNYIIVTKIVTAFITFNYKIQR